MSGCSLVPEELASLIDRRWLLVGIGNDMRGDDAFGPVLARRLRRKGLPALDAGTAPENVTGWILRARPEAVILADTADMGEKIGTLRLLDPRKISGGGPSTHDPGLALLLSYLSAHQAMNAWILAVQPGPLGLGAAMSAEVRGALELLAAFFESSRAYA